MKPTRTLITSLLLVPRAPLHGAEQIGRDTRYPSLNFSTSGSYSFSYTRSGVAIPPETSPARAFAKMFVDGTPAEVAEEVARVQTDLTRIVTLHRGRTSKTPSKLGTSDKEALAGLETV